MRRGGVLRFVLAVMLAAVAGGVEAQAQTLDDGLLDPAWFGLPGIELRKTEEIDYLWVKPGLTLEGTSLKVDDWSDPEIRGKKRDAKDSAKAVEVSEQFPALLKGALMSSLAGVAKVSRKEGDLVLTGRIVDCNAGSKAAKWLVGMGAGAASATWDMKLTDPASGEVVLAIHHRAISGTNMSEIDDKIIKWLEKLGEALKGDIAKAYAAGKKATK
jgi:hypothetical protein